MRIHTKICFVCGMRIEGDSYFLERIVIVDGIPINEYICNDCRDKGRTERNQTISDRNLGWTEEDHTMYKVRQRKLSLS